MNVVGKPKVCRFPQIALLHTGSGVLNKQNSKKFKLIHPLEQKKNVEPSKKDYMKLLKKAEESIINPSPKYASNLINQLTKSLSNHNAKIKIKAPFLKPRKNLLDTTSFSSPLVRCFEKTPEDLSADFGNWPSIYGDDDELKRLFLFQECLRNEIPFHAEIPIGDNQKTFMISPNSWVKDLTEKMPMREKSFQFLMLKYALRNTEYRKRLKKVKKSEKELTKPPFNQIGHVKLLPMFGKLKMRQWSVQKHACSYYMLQPLVIDMRFHRQKDECSVSLMKQLHHLFMANYSSNNPFHLVFANFDQNTDFYHKVWNASVNTKLDLSTTMTSKALHELEPIVKQEDLVYLSPDATTVMTEFDHSKTYVIGGLVDRLFEKNRTKTISRTEHINSMKLPLQRYLSWGGVTGQMELTLHAVFDILNTLKHTGCWIKALSCMPHRLHRGLSELGRELANYDPEIISRFDAGRQWKKIKDKKAPRVVLPVNLRKRSAWYLGKS